MTGYLAFTKKELKENTKNFRLLVMVFIFLIFGLSSPLLARFTPEILSAFASGMDISVTPPAAMDSWEQYYKNISGIGFSALIILFGSMLSSEYSKGTLIIMLTKGLSRPSVILAKFTASAAVMTLCYWASFAVTYGYTAFLFHEPPLPHTLFAALALWIIGFLYLSILLLGCVLFRQTFTSILFTGGMAALFSLLTFVKQTEPYNPFILTSRNLDLLSGKAVPSEFFIPMLLTLVLIIVSLCAAVKIFNKKQL